MSDKKLGGLDVAKVAKKFDLDQQQITDIEVLGGTYTDYTLVVWLKRPHWCREGETEIVDSSHNVYAGELERLR